MSDNATNRHRESLLDAVKSSKRTSGLTHNFYRYPARFGAEFAREAIRYFTKNGDVVLDPFMGGGTTAVEALGAGRKFVGSDINELALFVTEAKSSLISSRDEAEICKWAEGLPENIHLGEPEPRDKYPDRYKQHLPWRLRKVISQSMASLNCLGNERQKIFARCSLLGTAQWALDCKTKIPSKEEFLVRHELTVNEMLTAMQEYRAALHQFGITPNQINKHRALVRCNASRLHRLATPRKFGTPKLLLTSPPYLGVHVLYHRWQIQGRRETAAPYWIADKSDGHTGIYYTFVDRRDPAVGNYMARLKACFSSATKLLDEKSYIAQLVAFSDAEIQLPVYLRALNEIGLELCETFHETAKGTPIERNVPNRRWYAWLSQQSTSSKEFLLVHRLKKGAGR